MQDLRDWLTRQLEEKRTEPNSALGGAIGYMLKHWDRLTLFLRQAGAPLDNNLCERALKKAILHRKNALFYKTRNGTRVGDLFNPARLRAGAFRHPGRPIRSAGRRRRGSTRRRISRNRGTPC